MRTPSLALLLLLLPLGSCGPSEVAVEEAGRDPKPKPAQADPLAEAAPLDLGEGLLLTVGERGKGDFVRSGGHVRVHYRARVLAAPPVEVAEASEASEAIEELEAVEPVEETVEAESDDAAAGEAPAAPEETEETPAEAPEVVEPVGEVEVAEVAELAEDATPAAAAKEYFDSSFARGVPDLWDLSSTARPRLIEGLRRGLVGLTVGSKVTLTIPAALAWGEDGLTAAGIPPNADVRYEIEILEVLP